MLITDDDKLQGQIIKGLLSKDFFDKHADKLPESIFGKDIKKLLFTIKDAHAKFGRDLSLEEVHRYHVSINPMLTEAQKMNVTEIFAQLGVMGVIGPDIAADLLERAWVQARAQDIAQIGLDIMNGENPGDNLQKLKRLVESCEEKFTPKLDLKYEDMSIDGILKGIEDEDIWNFNIPALATLIPGVSPTHFVVAGARPNVGKTSLHATLVAAPGGFAWQGAVCHVALNEEAARRVARRYLTSATGLSLETIKDNPSYAAELYNPIRDKLKLFTANGMSIEDLDRHLDKHKPDVMVVDMLDKVQVSGSFARDDQRLREVYLQARELGKRHECVIIGFSQLSAEAEGITTLSQDMLEGSKTGKAAEADLMILVGKKRIAEGMAEDDPMRYINVAKNKINGIHGMRPGKLRGDIGRYVE